MRDRRITIDREERTVTIERDGERVEATIDGRPVSMRVLDQSDGELLVEIEGRRHSIPFLRRGDVMHFHFDGEIWEAEIASPFQGKKREKEHSFSAPMPGSVLRIHVTVGEAVAKGTPLITLEAMKMEHQIVAPYDGVVSVIDCFEGAMVQPGVDLISVDPPDESV